jgi:chromosome segregation ATPase
MNIMPTEDELDLAVKEFKKTFRAFEKAAKKLMSILESMNKKKYQESKTCFDEIERIYKFIIKRLGICITC